MPTLASDLDFKHVLGAHRGEILIHRDGIERMVVFILAHQAFQLVGHLAAALQRRDQAALQRQFGRIAVHGLRAQPAASAMNSFSAPGGSERARVTSWL